MSNLEFFKKQSKNFLKDWKSQKKIVETDGNVYFRYSPKFFDIEDWFSYFELNVKDEQDVKNNTLGYFAVTAIVCLIWFITIPGWKSFMANVLQFSDVDKLFSLVMVLLGFYVLYALQNVFDSEFYGLGKTNYMLFESVVTNTIYYGVAFILYLADVWKPTLIGIALLFGFGNAFDSIVSGGAYAFLLKKKKINILEVE